MAAKKKKKKKKKSFAITEINYILNIFKYKT